MRIIYFTTCLEENDFVAFSKKWTIALNSSNQNFHNKMIRALAINNTVDVISIRPFSRAKCHLTKLESETKSNGNITWHYLKVSYFRLLRFTFFRKEIEAFLKRIDKKNVILISDTINPTVIHFANEAKKITSLPLVGICTDSPSNISGTKKSYAKYILENANNLNGYIALTEELNNHFNKNNKPSVIIEGLIENNLPEKKENRYKDYFFFGGALMEKYGVYNLIRAFKELNRPDLKLIICGHHGDNNRIYKTISNNKNIIYLKCLPVADVIQLEIGAIANINPRPYSEDLDRFSIPSKTIEYLSSNSPTISVKNSKLKKKFYDDIIWAKSANPEDLKTAMETVLTFDENERKTMAIKARNKAIDYYSLNSVNKLLNEFLLNIIK